MGLWGRPGARLTEVELLFREPPAGEEEAGPSPFLNLSPPAIFSICAWVNSFLLELLIMVLCVLFCFTSSDCLSRGGGVMDDGVVATTRRMPDRGGAAVSRTARGRGGGRAVPILESLTTGDLFHLCLGQFLFARVTHNRFCFSVLVLCRLTACRPLSTQRASPRSPRFNRTLHAGGLSV